MTTMPPTPAGDRNDRRAQVTIQTWPDCSNSVGHRKLMGVHAKLKRMSGTGRNTIKRAAKVFIFAKICRGHPRSSEVIFFFTFSWILEQFFRFSLQTGFRCFFRK